MGPPLFSPSSVSLGVSAQMWVPGVRVVPGGSCVGSGLVPGGSGRSGAVIPEVQVWFQYIGSGVGCAVGSGMVGLTFDSCSLPAVTLLLLGISPIATFF